MRKTLIIALAIVSLTHIAQSQTAVTDTEKYEHDLDNAQAVIAAVEAYKEVGTYQHPSDAKQLRYYATEMLWYEAQMEPLLKPEAANALAELIQGDVEWCNKWAADYDADPQARRKRDKDADAEYAYEQVRKMAEEAACAKGKQR